VDRGAGSHDHRDPPLALMHGCPGRGVLPAQDAEPGRPIPIKECIRRSCKLCAWDFRPARFVTERSIPG
jgi:hypothetical protein